MQSPICVILPDLRFGGFSGYTWIAGKSVSDATFFLNIEEKDPDQNRSDTAKKIGLDPQHCHELQ